MRKDEQAREEIRQAIRRFGPVSPTQIAALTRISKNTVKKILKEFCHCGVCELVAKGQYRLPQCST